MTTHTDPVTGFIIRNNEPDPTPKPVPPLTEKAQLEQRLRDKGQLTPEMQAELNKTFPDEPIRPFGDVGQGVRGERSSGNPLDIKDHQDFLNRKAEIMAAAFPDHRN